MNSNAKPSAKAMDHLEVSSDACQQNRGRPFQTGQLVANAGYELTTLFHPTIAAERKNDVPPKRQFMPIPQERSILMLFHLKFELFKIISEISFAPPDAGKPFAYL